MTQEIALINLSIDGINVQVPKGTTVYHAAKQLGLDIPIFCYQDRMKPFGACRVCLVEVEKMGKLQTSCTLEATEGMVVRTQSAPAVEGRKSILELLLINHPLDCPVCDKGGECPLQEQALDHGPGESRFFEEKRHFEKPIPLGPVLMLDRERCIICARCTRFGEHVAGDNALQLIDRGFKSEVGTADGGTPQSKFIGNTIKICPVGALTSQVYRFRARPWDNKPTPSTCTLCPVGCSMIIDSRDGEVMRIRSQENKEVNDIWLCDKGWFGYEFTYAQERLNTPLIRKDGKLQEASWDEALTLIADKLQKAKASGKIAAWGGNPLTFEENYLFQALMRQGLGTPHLDHRIGEPIISLNEEGLAPGMQTYLSEVDKLPFTLLLGLDITEEFPVIWLRLKQALNNGGKLIYSGHYALEIVNQITATELHSPGEEIAQIKKLSETYASEKVGAVFVGGQYLNSPNRKEILAEIQKAFPELSLNIMEGNGNSMGARLGGMRPDLAPLNEEAKQKGMSALEVLEEASRSHWDILYVAGANPATKFAKDKWTKARQNIGFVVVQDLFVTETAEQADVVLPAFSYIEKGGHFINIEGRLQPLLPGKELPENVHSDGDIFKKLADKLNLDLGLDKDLEKILAKPILKNVTKLSSTTPKTAETKSGLKISFSKALFDEGVRMKHNPHVKELAKAPFIRIHPDHGAELNIAQEEAVILTANGKSIKGIIALDKKVAKNTVIVPVGYAALPVADLELNYLNGQSVELKRETD